MKDKNFLFTAVGGKNFTTNLVKRLIKTFDISNAYATIDDAAEDISIFKETIRIWDAFVAKYPENMYYPFDRGQRDSISEYAIEVIQQISRNGNYDYERRVNEYYAHLCFWDNFLDTRKISFVVFSYLPHESYDYVIYLLCKKKNIPTCMCYEDLPMRLLTSKGYYMMEKLEEPYVEIEDVYKKLKAKCEANIECGKGVEEYIEKVKKKFENVENKKIKLFNNDRKTKIRRDYEDPREGFTQWRKKSINARQFLNIMYVYGMGVYKSMKLARKYEKIAETPIYTDKYVYYALHYQPECTSSPLGGIYANQMLAIKVLASSLPENVWLYVKEHPVQTSFCREKTYYEELKKIPKVKLISQRIPSEILMKNAVAVASLTGTVFLETQIIQKPCICMGYSPRIILNGIYKIDTLEECKNALREIVDGKEKVTTIQELKLFFNAMEECCFDTYNEQEVYEKYCTYIKKYM